MSANILVTKVIDRRYSDEFEYIKVECLCSVYLPGELTPIVITTEQKEKVLHRLKDGLSWFVTDTGDKLNTYELNALEEALVSFKRDRFLVRAQEENPFKQHRDNAK